MSKLASIQRILEINDIPNAQKISVCKILGFSAVVKKGEFKVGDLVVYCACDSILPFAPWSEFLRDKNRPDRAIRVKTIRLRGQVSQGLVLPLSVIMDQPVFPRSLFEGDDVTEILGIKKWEKELAAELMGTARSNFPSYIPKTDEENIKSNPRILEELLCKHLYATIKIDGQSSTFYFNQEGQFGACSRKLDLLPGTGRSNMWWRMVDKYDLENKLVGYFATHGKHIAIQAEIFGESIQGNKLGIAGNEIAVFDVWDIDNQKYYNYPDIIQVCKELQLPLVPVIWENEFITESETIESLTEKASKLVYPNGTPAEGMVVRPILETHSEVLGGSLSIKIMNPVFQLLYGE